MLRRFFAMLLLLCWLPSVATATEYRITEQQLKRLESNLIQLKAINQELQKELELLHKKSKEQENSLTSASISFNEYAASQQAKMRKIKAERNALLVLLSGAVVSLVAKK